MAGFSQALMSLTVTSTQILHVQVRSSNSTFSISVLEGGLRKSQHCTQAWQQSKNVAALGCAAATAVSESVSAHALSHDALSCCVNPHLDALLCSALVQQVPAGGWPRARARARPWA